MKAQPQEIKTAWNAASFYIGSSKRTPSSAKIAKHFGTTTDRVLKIVTDSK